MARGDLRSSRSSGGGSGYSYDYDDEGRGHSKSLYEEFESFFEASGYSSDWLLNVDGIQDTLNASLYDARLYKYVHNMTSRYNLDDWAWRTFDDSPENDGRVRRIVVKKCGLDIWHLLQTRAERVWNEQKELEKIRYAQQSEKWKQERASFEAKRIKRLNEEKQQIMKDVDLIAGALQADFQQAFTYTEVYGRDEGDWLDDPVESYVTTHGFGEEEKQASGIKLQITVSIDCSNSMYYNNLAVVASESFRDIYLALEKLQSEHPHDLHIAAFEFSLDGYEASDRGKRASCISVNGWSKEQIISKDQNLGAVNNHRDIGTGYGKFTGEDTWFYTLFEEIEKWEYEYSDPGAYKLDIVITDAVLEHPSDIRRSDAVQERRDGSLQTIMLNFMPEEDWVNSDLPSRCVQYPANPTNIGGLLRTIITEFVSVHI